MSNILDPDQGGHSVCPDRKGYQQTVKVTDLSMERVNQSIDLV